ncbi:MAG: TonB C-terminal domain-containing protein [Syntrophaceae bacterium]|nr:TonB C-terminal domain-containing protein [Syntrophaceae bacterium]
MTGSTDAITLDRELVESISKLRERPYGKSTLGPVIVCSVVLHIVLLSFILFKPMTTSTKLTFGTYYTVDLVRSADLSGGSSYRSTFAEEMKGLLSEKQGIVLRKKPVSLDLPPIKRLDSREKSPQEVTRAIEALKKKVSAAEQGKAPAAATDIGMGGASPEADAVSTYYGTIWSRIKAKWTFPGGLASGKNLVAVVYVRIMRNGTTEGVSLQQRSANALFNESALKAVIKASPFPSFPAGVNDRSMDLGIRFHSAQLAAE